MSYVELIGVLSGLISVWFASRANIITWPTGIINEFFLFILFFQVQLYADMLLQVFFFVTTIFGWFNWGRQSMENKIGMINRKQQVYLFAAILFGSLVAGYFIANLHQLLPQYFPVRASYPYIDSLIMVLSIAATVLLAYKKLENWYCWLLTDLICVILYFVKGIYFLSIEYFIFLILAAYGSYNWKRKLVND